MKKILVLSILIILFGCSDNYKFVVEEAINNTNQLDNLTVDIDIGVKCIDNDASIETAFTYNQKIDYKNNIIKYKTNNFNFFGETLKYEGYQKKVNNKVLSYFKEDSLWFVKILVNDSFNKFFEDSDYEVRKTFDNKYELTITKDEMLKMLVDIDINNFEIQDDQIKIIMTVEDNYISTLEYNLNLNVKQGKEKYIMETSYYYHFYNYNITGDLEIPKNILDHSMDVQDYNTYVYAYNYLVTLDNYLYDFYDDMIFTDCNLDYDGPKPDEVKIYIEEGYITDGVIVVEDYQFRIKEGQIIEALKLSNNI